MIGESEVQAKTVVVKDLRNGAEQITLSQADLVATLKTYF